MRRAIFLIVLTLVGSGCGKKKPVITQPTEGQVFQIGQNIVITLEEYDGDTQVSIRGRRPAELQCVDGVGQAYCTWTWNPNNVQTFDMQTSYTLIAIANRGQEQTFVTFEVQRQNFQSQPVPPQ